MSSKTKQKGSKKQKPKNTSSNNSMPFDASAINKRCGRNQQQQTFAMASRHNPEMDGIYPPLQNFTMSSTPLMYRPSSRPHTANSRVPVYTANGMTHGYTPPNEGYNTPHPYFPLEYDCHMPPHNYYQYRNQYYGQPYRTHRSTPIQNLVPYDVKLQQAFHKCQMACASSFNHRSAPVSARTTPSNSVPGTPHDCNRRKDFFKSSCSTPSKLSRQPSIQTSSSASLSSKSRKFESYLPLCEVQKAMKKGEVIEGVLRINPRNYEDAYISAPDGQMDIYIGGIVDRNRAMNGDRVAVRINPMNEWKILFDTIRLHWSEWSEHLLKCVNEPNTSRSSHSNSINLCTNTANLAAIPENSCLTTATNGITACTEKAKIVESGAINPSTYELQLQSQMPESAMEPDLISNLLPQSFNSPNLESHDSVACNSANAALDRNESKSEKKKEAIFFYRRRRQRKRKRKSVTKNVVTNNLLEMPKDSDSLPSFDEFDDSVNVTEQKQMNGNQQCAYSNEDELLAKISSLSCNDSLIQVQGISDASKSMLREQKASEPSVTSMFVPLEELVDEQWVDMSSNENGCSDVEHEVEAKMEDVAFIEEEIVDSCNLLNPLSVNENEAVDNVDECKESVVNNGQSLETMIMKLNGMTKISSNDNKGKKNKKKNKCKSQPKKVVIRTDVEDVKNVKVQTKPKLKNTFGLPEAVLSINVLDLLKLPFGAQCVQKTGKVIRIIEHIHPRIAGGKLKLTADRNPNFALFSPVDSKVPRMVIDKNQCPSDFFQHPDHYAQTLFLAQMEEWSDSSTFPKGKLLKALGDINSIDAQTEMILMENCIDDTEYDDVSCIEFLKLLDKNGDFKVPQKERKNRRSFRLDCVFTIDPSTARDLDDALSVKVLDERALNGQQLYEVGVHIADVTYFLQQGNSCDATARQRTTSVYLVQKVIPMLPRILCEKLCSLNPGEEKLTFSVVWKMDIDGNAYEEWFGRTVIESCVKLSYELAQDMIDDPEKEWCEGSLPQIYGNWNAKDISERVNILMTIARSLRKRRFEDGALCLEAMKFSFVLNPENGLPLGFSPESRRESNFLVEEFMLAANMAVAHRIYNEFPELSFLRCHPPPDAKLLRDFYNFCENANLEVNVSSPEAFKKSVSKLVAGDNLNAKVISYYFLRSITMAMYFCSGMTSSKESFRHYALSVPLYTHFTSPIRRYADVVVHRLLSAALKYTPQITDDAMDLHRLAKRCNDMKMAAANASEQSSKLFVNLYLKTVGPVIEQGVVSQVLDHAFDVIIPKFGHMARIFIESLDVKSFQYRTQAKTQQLELVWNNVDEANAHQVISAFSVVSVRISVNENDLTKWNVTLLALK